MKKISKQASAFILSCLMAIFFVSVGAVLAGDVNNDPMSGLDTASDKVDAYKVDKIEMGDAGPTPTGSTGAKDYLLARVGGFIGYGLSLVGLIFFAIVLYAGFKWMMARGNAAETEKARELIYDAIIGLILVSGAYLITIIIGEYLAPT